MSLSGLHRLAGGTRSAATRSRTSKCPHRPADARQICNGRDTILKSGLYVTSFAYPGAAHSPATEAIARECGFSNAGCAAVCVWRLQIGQFGAARGASGGIGVCSCLQAAEKPAQLMSLCRREHVEQLRCGRVVHCAEPAQLAESLLGDL